MGLDLGGALEDRQDARVAQHAAHRIFKREAVAAMDLERIVGGGPLPTGWFFKRALLNGTDVTSALRADATGRTMVALVKGLNDGSNALVATAGKATAKATVANHPGAGPVISGPHETPFVCETETFTLMSGGTAGKALDADCSIATRVDYVYKSTAPAAPAGPGRGSDNTFKPLPDPKTIPSDVAMVTTSLGVQAPFIVRVETGTINRGVYEIAMLFNPAKDAQPDFMTKPSGWNGRLIYTFGGGCAGGWYKQGTGTGGVVFPEK